MNDPWKKFPDTKPSGIGYHMTCYYNEVEGGFFYKAFIWNGEKWCYPRYNVNENVRFFLDKCYNFYVPCEMGAYEDADFKQAPLEEEDNK